MDQAEINNIKAVIDYFEWRLQSDKLLYRERPSIHYALKYLNAEIDKWEGVVDEERNGFK